MKGKNIFMENETNLFLNNQLANDILERQYYSYFRKGQKKIELYFTANCKANCEYCYLKKHQKELYPNELSNPKQIVQNLQLILDWYVENKFTCPLDIFSAEWLTTSWADQIFDCFYNTFSKVPIQYRPEAILAADNMQFLKDPILTEKIEEQITKLKELGIQFPLSASVDGKYCDFGRSENDDEFYKKLSDFLDKYNCLAHPMISSNNIKYWKENYEWWATNFSSQVVDNIMTLEVRDETWTEESIQDLIIYCDFLIDRIFKNYFKENKREFLKYVLNLRNSPDDIIQRPKYIGYNIIALNHTPIDTNTDSISCSFTDSLPIRLGDLSVGLCHRLYYPELIIGKYELKNNKIFQLNVNNVALLIMKTHLKRSILPHCENCKFVGCCIGFCLGASYENYKNPLVPCQETCNMYLAKNSFLIYKYYTMGLFDYLEDFRDELGNNYTNYLQDLIATVIGGLNSQNGK